LRIASYLQLLRILSIIRVRRGTLATEEFPVTVIVGPLFTTLVPYSHDQPLAFATTLEIEDARLAPLVELTLAKLSAAYCAPAGPA
jgi:hypothetical protein